MIFDVHLTSADANALTATRLGAAGLSRTTSTAPTTSSWARLATSCGAAALIARLWRSNVKQCICFVCHGATRTAAAPLVTLAVEGRAASRADGLPALHPRLQHVPPSVAIVALRLRFCSVGSAGTVPRGRCHPLRSSSRRQLLAASSGRAGEPRQAGEASAPRSCPPTIAAHRTATGRKHLELGGLR